MNRFVDGFFATLLVLWRIVSEVYRWPARMGDRLFGLLFALRIKGRPEEFVKLVYREGEIMRRFYRPGERHILATPHVRCYSTYCSDSRLGSHTNHAWMKHGFVAEGRNPGAATTLKGIRDVRLFVNSKKIEVVLFGVHTDCAAFAHVRSELQKDPNAQDPLIDDIRQTPARIRALMEEFADKIESGKLVFDFSETDTHTGVRTQLSFEEYCARYDDLFKASAAEERVEVTHIHSARHHTHARRAAAP